MNATVHVFDSMIHNFVGVVAGQSLIREQGIGVERGASFYVFLYFRLQQSLFTVTDNLCANLTTTFQNAHDSSLILTARTSNAALAHGDVHVAGLAPDK